MALRDTAVVEFIGIYNNPWDTFTDTKTGEIVPGGRHLWYFIVTPDDGEVCCCVVFKDEVEAHLPVLTNLKKGQMVEAVLTGLQAVKGARIKTEYRSLAVRPAKAA